jgi:hypothetical protein
VHYSGDFSKVFLALKDHARVGQCLGLGGSSYTDLLFRVLEHKRSWKEAGITGPESEAEATAAATYQEVLDYLEHPTALLAEAKRLGLEETKC